MPSYLWYKKHLAVLDKDDIQWITVKGNHIPIKNGETKEEAVERFLKDKAKTQKASAKAEVVGKSGNVAKVSVSKGNEKEAREKIKSFVYEGGKIDLSGVYDFDNVEEINNALDDIQKKYPFHLDEISTFNSKGVRLAQAEGTHKIQIAKHFANMNNEEKQKLFEDNTKDFRKLTQNKIDDFNNRYINNDKSPEIVKKKAAAQIKIWEKDLRYERHNVFSSPENTIKAIVYHEMGHILMFRSPDSNYIVQQAMNAAIATRDIYKISSYAGTNKYEFFAECFSAKMQGEKLPSYIENMLTKVLPQ